MGYAQSQLQIHFPKYVECYYPHEIGPLLIYNNYEGSPIDTLDNSSKFCWYKIAIQSTRGAWLQIENLIRIPDRNKHSENKDIHRYKNMWVRADNFLINLPEFGAKLYHNADNESDYIELDKFAKGNVIEIKGLWAKVSIDKGSNKRIEGWIKRSDQCALPFTTCNWEFVDETKQDKNP